MALKKELLLNVIRSNSFGDVQQSVSEVLALFSLMSSNRNDGSLNRCRDECLIFCQLFNFEPLYFFFNLIQGICKFLEPLVAPPSHRRSQHERQYFIYRSPDNRNRRNACSRDCLRIIGLGRLWVPFRSGGKQLDRFFGHAKQNSSFV